MRKQEVIAWAWSELETRLAERGYELVEVEHAQQGGTWIVRLYIDKAEGITLEDCQTVSRFVDPLLEACPHVSEDYRLEISSPGFDRPIRKPRDFERFTGENVKLRTDAPIEGRKRFAGVLESFEDGILTINCEGKNYAIHVNNLQKANLDR